MSYFCDDDGVPDIDDSEFREGTGAGSGTPASNSDDYGDESSP